MHKSTEINAAIQRIATGWRIGWNAVDGFHVYFANDKAATCYSGSKYAVLGWYRAAVADSQQYLRSNVAFSNAL
ncbi:MAG: hypothetical protein ACREHV_06435 [Rhizomicrobium sp.]